MPALPKQELRQLIAIADTGEALRQLLDLLAGAPAQRKQYDAMTLLCGQWQDLDERVHLNLLTFKETGPDRARINQAVLHYLDQLPDEVESPKGKKPAPEALLRQTMQAIAADETWEYDLFFSFSSKDVDAARNFCHQLRGHGLRVFFSADDLRLRGGHNFGEVIERALRQSRHFLLFCSPNAMASPWVKLEHETFFQSHHLPDEKARGFYIAEGPDFQEGLVPVFYRRLQRTSAPEDLLHALAAVAPKPQQNPPPPRIVSRAISHEEQFAWEITEEDDTPAAYERFLVRYPEGHYAPKAQARLDEFRADDRAFEFADEHGAVKAYRKYLEKYPGGLHTDKAKRAIDPFHGLMIPIKGGTFEMGSNEEDLEKPIRRVTVPDFLLCKYPVTQAQWKAIMGDNPSYFKGEDLPVEMVSWYDAQAFIQKLRERTGLPYRLSTEAEWEYAARGGVHSLPIGEGRGGAFTYAGSNDLNEVGWYWENSGDKPLSGEWKRETIEKNNGRTHPVGQKKANELGLYDMSGNVWEWCEDDWHKNYQGAPNDGPAWVDSPQRGAGRVVRGGSWDSTAPDCRAAYRLYGEPGNRGNYLGFRLALCPQSVG